MGWILLFVAVNWGLVLLVSLAVLGWRLAKGGRWVGFRPWPTVELDLPMWGGQCLGVLVTVDPGLLGTSLEVHEGRHAWQQAVLGALQWVLYVAHWAWLSSLRWPDRHGYYDNVLERDARRAAGQTVDIPRIAWTVPRWGILGGALANADS